ncbi:non-ribosomal peptide synthetase [Actinacidiphila epipremni]|uniref:Phenyloxazoline synthase MbtB n=1 Tax=Actinacidiphila epipremni TaxID=2053013 RepID=A0ABX0ZPF9_9ACTN|nr:non-ribosomal peptide synthetase [Actinacidiphila epipremni]NJP43478.1 amino acid adenylation domain-containing protein [Actinacidiphila epipremni]
MISPGQESSGTRGAQSSAVGAEAVRDAVAGLLGLAPGELPDDADLTDCGMDSIRLMSLAGWLRRHGVPVDFPVLAERPTLAAWTALAAAAAVPARRAPAAAAPAPAPGEPFDLTPVQHAYWIGRRDDQPLGGVGCHAYVELDGTAVEPDRLEAAVRAVLARHGMLRARFLPDGRQQVLPRSPWPGLTVYDLRAADHPEARLTAVRDRLSHRRLRVERGEVFDVRLSLLPGRRTRVHLDVDLLVADVASISIVLADLAAAYTTGALPPPGREAGDTSFARYLAERAGRRADRRAADRLYWRERLADLPGGPALPLAADPDRSGVPRFTRRQHWLAPDAWQRFSRRARDAGATPAMALGAAYAEVLGAWSESPRFLLGLPLFDRDSEYPESDGLVADFTDLLLVTADLSAAAPFPDRVRALQADFRSAAAHRAYSGVEVLRDLARTDPDRRRRAPVVFACTPGGALVPDQAVPVLGAPGWTVSQTPQVWLDHQVYGSAGGVDLCWDSVDALFPPGVVDDMFTAYRELVDRLCAAGTDWEQPVRAGLPARQRAVRERANATARPRLPRTLHQPFFAHAERFPERPALFTGGGAAVTYGELARRALGTAAALDGHGMRPGEPVAVTAVRGADQIAAVLGVLAAGGTYLPLGSGQPAERRRRILQRAGVRLVLGDRAEPSAAGPAVLATGALRGHEPLAGPVPVDPDAPAYVIFTSGTTGEPKGVTVSHAAAAGTVDDVNERFAVGPDDRVLAVSALDFDLSVYDVFGLLSAGGALVLVDEDRTRDPRAWAELMAGHRVTVWNSVPLLLDMLLTGTAGGAGADPAFGALRLALLSGDRIPPDLPPRLTRRAAGCRVIALGGATEAAIWSNLHEVTGPLPGWTSVPYGFPLANQRFRVVGPDGADRPDWVAGELLIGGAGLALGYMGDAELTARRFPVLQGERWYRTGDRGRYRPDGALEFLGRLDQQVKVRGVRTEPGEVEAALACHPAVGHCVVTVVDRGGGKSLAAVATPAGAAAAPPHGVLPGQRPGSEVPAGTGSGGGRGAGAQSGRGSGDAAGRGAGAGAGRRAGAEPGRGAGDGPETDAGDGRVTGPEDEARVVESALAALLAGETGIGGAPVSLAGLARRWRAAEEWQPLLALWCDWLADRRVLSRGGAGYAAGPRMAEAVRGAGTGAVAEAGGRLAGVARQLTARSADLAAVVRGELDAGALLDDPVLAPSALASAPGDPAGAPAQALDDLGADRPLKVGVLTAGAWPDRCPAPHRFTLLGVPGRPEPAHAGSPAGRPRVRRLTGGLVPDDLLAAFDVVVADNALHTFPDPATGVGLAALLLAPGGTLLARERTGLPPLALIAAAVPTRGFSTLDPVRRERRTSLLRPDEWERLLSAHGLAPVSCAPPPPGGQVLLRAAKAEGAGLPPGAELREWLAARLPAAMLPDQLLAVPALPVTGNGKVDRAALARLLPEPEDTAADADPPRGPAEHALAAVWRELLGLSRVGRDQNFFGLGGDSLLATRLVSRLRAGGFSVDLSAVFAAPVLCDLARHLTPEPPRDGRRQDPGVVADPAHRHDPFPLTDVQRAYWAGRAAGMPLGGVGAHYYLEFDGAGLDLGRLEKAYNQLVARHEMLRCVVDEHGDQRILAEVPQAAIAVTHAAPGCREAALADLRAAMSHQVRDPGRWPLLDLRAVVYERDGEQRVRLGVSLENLVLDGRSMSTVLAELGRLYRDPAAVLPAVDGLSFRDYVLGTAPSDAELEAAGRYWSDRLPDLPPAPALPLAVPPSAVPAPRFVRRSGLLPADRWQAVTERAGRYGLTPSAVLLTCYAEVLGMWSGRRDLTVNLTLFDRREVHPAVHDIVGDFTSLLPLAYRPEQGAGFLDRARALQHRLGQDLGHRAWSSVRVARELAKAGGPADGALPVVFTSALGTAPELSFDLSEWLLPKVWSVSQTPQTWLDNQVYDSPSGLHYDWDAVEQLLPPAVLDPMFAAYGRLLDWLSAADWDTAVPDLLPQEQRAVREAVNATAAALPDCTLHEGFFAQARRDPGRTACVGAGGPLTYGELAGRALRLAGRLRAAGVAEGAAVAVSVPRGPGQLVAVLGVLAAGAAYVPVGYGLPALRRERLYRSAGVCCVLTAGGGVASDAVPDGVEVVDVTECSPVGALPGPVAVDPGGPAYVIFTSGSTGEPKGVEMTHRAAMNTVTDVVRRFGIGPGDRVLTVSALDFDLSVFDIFGILGQGGTLVLVGEDERRDPERWVESANAHGVTVWNSAPTLLDMLLLTADTTPLTAPLRLALVSGDWVPLDLKPRLTAHRAACRLVALGGATEAGIWSNFWDITHLDPAWTSIPYGRPLANQRFRVVDPFGQDCPDLVPGELWIGGTSLATGYRNDPAHTARSFVHHHGNRWYRTGDLARYLTDGTLEFLGRTDHQLKINGHRTEPAEIETTLESHPAVRRAVVTAEQAGPRRRLVAHAVPAGGPAVPDDLLPFLRERLPRHAVPEAVLLYEELPLTANGKVDRAALAARAAAGTAGAAGEAPRTDAERLVAAVWSDLLAVPEPTREQDFFRLGGDSLLATKAVARLRAAGVTGAELGALFTSPVLADFAAGLTVGRVRERGPAVTADPAARHLPFPPTELQRAYWVGRSAAFTLGGVGSYYYCEFDEEDLDPGRLEAAWNRLIDRHEMLRAVFDEDGRQRILPQVPPLAVPVAVAAEGGAEAELAALRAAMSHQVLDPARWPLFDVRAVRYGNRTRVGIGLDYLLVDGLSMMVLFAELDLLQRDPDAELPPVGVSFRDYATQVQPPPAEAERSRRYWARHIPELPPPPRLPLATDPAAVVRPRFERRETWLDAGRWQALRDRARQHGCTPSAVLFACFAEVLGAWSSRRDLTVALTLFDRREVHPDIDRVLGDFTSLLPVAHRPAPGESFGQRLRGLQERLWRDLDHRGAPVLELLREAAGPRAGTEAALPVVFTSALGVDDTLSDGLRRPVWSVSQTPQVWLDEQVMARDGGLLLTWDAAAELFPAGMLDAMFAAHDRLLDWVCSSDWSGGPPDLLPREQRAVREAVNATAAALPDNALHEGFFAQARQHPGRTACVGAGGPLTYGELADRALRIAAGLRARGVRPGEPVGVTLPKGPRQIAAVLGVLAAGAAYLPVGPDQPPVRRDRMLAAAGVRLTIGEQDGTEATGALPGPVAVDPGATAYVIFTSGSTGEPKGVEMTHRAAMNTVTDVVRRFGIGPDDRVLTVSALDFDLSVFDVFGILGQGGTLVLVAEDERRDPERWLELANTHRVTVWNSVPTLLDMLLTAADAAPLTAPLRLALVSGDWVPLNLKPRLAAHRAASRLVALGGATEAGIWSNFWDITHLDPAWTSIPYGRPLANQRFRVVDPFGQDCPDLVPGELWIGGTSLATGYRNDPAHTARSFVHHHGNRWYRTGDLARYLTDGTLEFLGRTDHQLKINGHRTEPAEIETTLHAHPAVRRAVVVPAGQRGSRRLHAFVTATADGVHPDELRDFVRQRLPRHACPSGYTLLDELPLTANGKIDRAALVPPAPGAAGPADEPPRGPVEEAVAAVWAAVLHRESVPRDATFFALGGDSLQATRLVQRLRAEFRRDIPLRELLAEPTVAGVARLIACTNPGTEHHDMEDGSL